MKEKLNTFFKIDFNQKMIFFVLGTIMSLPLTIYQLNRQVKIQEEKETKNKINLLLTSKYELETEKEIYLFALNDINNLSLDIQDKISLNGNIFAFAVSTDIIKTCNIELIKYNFSPDIVKWFNRCYINLLTFDADNRYKYDIVINKKVDFTYGYVLSMVEIRRNLLKGIIKDIDLTIELIDKELDLNAT